MQWIIRHANDKNLELYWPTFMWIVRDCVILEIRTPLEKQREHKNYRGLNRK